MIIHPPHAVRSWSKIFRVKHVKPSQTWFYAEGTALFLFVRWLWRIIPTDRGFSLATRCEPKPQYFPAADGASAGHFTFSMHDWWKEGLEAVALPRVIVSKTASPSGDACLIKLTRKEEATKTLWLYTARRSRDLLLRAVINCFGRSFSESGVYIGKFLELSRDGLQWAAEPPSPTGRYYSPPGLRLEESLEAHGRIRTAFNDRSRYKTSSDRFNEQKIVCVKVWAER